PLSSPCWRQPQQRETPACRSIDSTGLTRSVGARKLDRVTRDFGRARSFARKLPSARAFRRMIVCAATWRFHVRLSPTNRLFLGCTYGILPARLVVASAPGLGPARSRKAFRRQGFGKIVLFKSKRIALRLGMVT